MAFVGEKPGLGASAAASASDVARAGRGIPGMGRRPQKRLGGRGAWAAPARGAWDPEIRRGVGGI